MCAAMRLAVGNKARVGKDTFAEYVVRKHGGRVIRIAAGVYETVSRIQEYLGVPREKKPELLQAVGTACRNVYGEDIWVSRALDEIKAAGPDENIIITDLRFKNEYRELKKAGFTTVRINRPGRPQDRDPNHISEVDLDDVEFDYTIENDGTLEEFYNKIDFIIETLKSRNESLST
jgi:hypothetical protein